MLSPFDMEIILASQSPRRLSLLQSLHIPVRVAPIEVSEDFDEKIRPEEVAQMLAERKANSLQISNDHAKNSVILAADTVVILEGNILNKPADEQEAKSMLQALSGKTHQVITGVCLRNDSRVVSFSETTQVYFSGLSLQEIDFYVERFRPLDKAGAYGIQEWIGMVAVEKIEGDFYNVMGLPLHRVWNEIQMFFQK